jgi:hypothetical protein
MTQRMKCIIASSSNSAGELVYFEAEDSEDDFDYEVEDVAQVFKSSVDCLMGLLPSMEKTLAMMAQICQEGRSS